MTMPSAGGTNAPREPVAIPRDGPASSLRSSAAIGLPPGKGQQGGLDAPSDLPQQRPLVSLRWALALLIASVFAPAVVFAALEYQRLVSDERGQVETTARHMAREVASTIDRELAIRATLLRTLAASPALQGGDLLTLYSQAKSAVDPSDGWIVLVDSSGRQHFNTRFAYDAELPGVGDLETLREVMRTGRLQLSDLFGGVARDVPVGRPLLSMSIPLTGERALTWRFQPGFFNDLLRRHMPPGWQASLVDRNGVLIARTEKAQEMVGRAASPDFRSSLEAEPQGGRASVTLDGVEAYTAWHRLTDGWTAVVFQPRDAATGPVTSSLNRLMMITALLGAVALILSGLLGGWIARQFRGVAKTAVAVAAGQPAPPFMPLLRETRDIDRALRAAARATEEQRRSEARLRASEARFHRVFEHAGMGIAITDWHGRLQLCNPAFCRLVGYALDELRELDFAALVHPDDRAANIAENTRLKNKEVPLVTIENRYVRKCGEPIWVNKVITPLGDETGEEILFVALVTDVTARRNAEEALRTSEERLRLASEAAGFGVHDFDVGARRGTWSAEMRRILGVAGEGEVPLETTLSTIHPGDRERVQAEMEAVMRRAGPYEIESRILRSDGEVRWILDRGQSFGPLDAVTGIAKRVMGTVIDITDRKRAETATQEALRLVENVMSSAPVSIYIFNCDTRQNELVNGRSGQLLGYDEAAWRRIVSQAMDLMHAEDAARMPDHFARIAAQDDGEPVEFEYRMRHADGSWRWFLSRDLPFERAPDGGLHKIIGTATDITERKHAEEALRESEERFRLMADGSPVIIWVTDRESRVEFINKTYRELAGIAPDADVAAMDWTRFVHPDDRAGYVGKWMDCTARHEPFEAQFRFDVHGVGYRWMKSTGRPRFTAGGDFLGYVGTSTDISDIKQAERQIRLLMREVNHRAKNMLAVVQAMVRQTARHVEDIDTFQEQINDRIASLASMHDLLVAQEWRGAPLRELIRAQLEPFVSSDSDSVDLQGPDLDVGAAAAQHLALAIHELATNSSKYGALSAPGGRVVLGWEATRTDGDAKSFRMRWTEHGGPPVQRSERRGFGSFVLERMVGAGLGGESKLDYAPDGLVWTLTTGDAGFLLDSVASGRAAGAG